MLSYEITVAAKNDLEIIWLHTFENWAIEQTDYYVELLLDEIEYLSKNPKSGQDFGSIRKGYFRYRVKSHFIFYKINLAEGIVEIIRILHQRMDISFRLTE